MSADIIILLVFTAVACIPLLTSSEARARATESVARSMSLRD